jgi:acyl-CoA thioester hydrolase
LGILVASKITYSKKNPFLGFLHEFQKSRIFHQEFIIHNSQETLMARIKLTLPSNLPFRTELPIRISDINYGGHLGNDAVLSLVHEARIRFLRNLGYTEFNIEGLGILMTDAIVVYSSEGHYGDDIIIETGVTDFQMTSCDFVFRLINKATEKEIARAKTGIVFMNAQTRKISPLPEVFHKKCNTAA